MATTVLEDPRMKLKICLVGEGNVGKTSLVGRFVYGAFQDRYLITLGTKVTKKRLRVKIPGSRESDHVALVIWDIMGMKGFRELLREAYFHGTQGILAVCDMTRPETLADLDGWKSSLEEVVGSIPTYVLANKVDLVEETRLSSDQLKAFCTKRGCPYVLTSAKTGENVEEAFEGLTRLILEGQARGQALPQEGA